MRDLTYTKYKKENRQLLRQRVLANRAVKHPSHPHIFYMDPLPDSATGWVIDNRANCLVTTRQAATTAGWQSMGVFMFAKEDEAAMFKLTYDEHLKHVPRFHAKRRRRRVKK